MLAFDSDQAPIVGQHVALTYQKSVAGGSRVPHIGQRYAVAIVEDREAILIPGLVVLHERGDCAIKDRRLHRVKRGKHPCDRARPGIRIIWQQHRMALRDMEYDRPRLEEGEIAFFIGRNLPERMKHTMRGFLHLTERKKTNVVKLAHFL